MNVDSEDLFDRALAQLEANPPRGLSKRQLRALARDMRDSMVAQWANMPRYVLVGCVAGKYPGRHAACDLYDSPLWRRRRQYAESTGAPWGILSGLHGVLACDEVIDCYECEFPTRKAERAAWGKQAAAKLGAEIDRLFGSEERIVVEFHAGAPYVDALEAALPDALAERLIFLRPMKGLGIGQQRGWYKRRLG